MNGRKQSHRILIVVTAICLITGIISSYFSGTAVSGERYYLSNSGGAVLFNHAQHVSDSESCADCHHTLYTVSDMTQCTDCHDEGFSAEDFTHQELNEIEGHRCSFCHMVDKARTAMSCRKCHMKIQESAITTHTCAECHDDSYTQELMSHDEYQEIEGHTCEGCHQASSLSDVYHGQCSSCHIREQEDRFTDNEGQVRCNACHLK